MLSSFASRFANARGLVGGALAVAGVGIWQGGSGSVAEADNSKYNKFQHPLVERYASKEMSFIWSPQNKFSTWRKMWIALAQVHALEKPRSVVAHRAARHTDPACCRWRFVSRCLPLRLLPKAENELGLPVSTEQIVEMKGHVHDIDFDLAKLKERELRHDVMAHIHTFGTICPKAMPIIHLGATSCFVGDNTDLIQLKDSLLVRSRARACAGHQMR